MKIKNAELKGIFAAIKDLPADSLPEVALVGRSNVGKSSLINKLVNRKNLARSSSTPGKTRTINYYSINGGEWYLVDLPGYGYARVSKAEQARWGQLIEKYLGKREQLRGVIQLIDIRHPPGQNDILMKEWLWHHNLPLLIIATKADKISRGSRFKHLSVIKKALELPAGQEPICFSALTGEGSQEIREAIKEILEFKIEKPAN